MSHIVSLTPDEIDRVKRSVCEISGKLQTLDLFIAMRGGDEGDAMIKAL